ncbi:CoA transferase [Rhodococcus qingshengii]|uniref:CaiB/BaiF CoA transferase family protein n=1 Tax=Rhodococcus TaxID=1827 RepID=UPI00067F47C5|nr:MULTISPECIES: CoA transferase [Rhodococcus]AUS34877.1 CoA transferase [Rhodococcus qingshengii]KZF14590.1 carnitine dehydratase [Rhodococcus sp. EPR-134]MCC4301764.1 CoA transferase [Rhodococcus sp. 3-2]MDF3317278.1 CoA transferase [Rhodococcus sp. C3V]OMQ34235.1 carnitine dehydratase [Rhodococcus sp. D-1]
MTDEVDLPLAGVRVVEIGQLIAIPSAGQQLSDLGAEVIKLEPPGGEPARQIDADYARGIFYGYNRGKRSICLDLKDSADLQRARDLIASSDILLHNLRPGTLDRLGFSSAELQRLRPEIIAVSVSGYGAEGPSATRAGLDIAAQAESGLMSVTGEADSPPQRVGAPVIDHATSYVVAQAVLAALLRRERTGKGSSVRVSLLDVAIHLQTANWIEWQVSGKPMSRKGNGQPSVAPAADVFRAADGELVISGYQPRAWIELCKAIDLPELADDPRFTTNALRVENRVDLVATIEKQLCHRSAAEAVEHLTAAGVVAALVRDYDQVIRADDVVANRTFIPGTNERGEQYLTPAMPYRAEPPMARTELSQVPALNEWTTSTR